MGSIGTVASPTCSPDRSAREPLTGGHAQVRADRPLVVTDSTPGHGGDPHTDAGPDATPDGDTGIDTDSDAGADPDPDPDSIPDAATAGRDGTDSREGGDRHVRVTVRHDGEETVLRTDPGANLRRLLVDAGLSPYTRVTSRANCGGRGLCATCGVRIRSPDPPPTPTHWHDTLAARFGYPRLSCQVTVDRDLTVALVDKLVWGGRE